MKRSCTIGILIAVLGTVVTFSPAHSTEARVAAMGGQGVLLRDDSNIAYFPATIMSYKDLAIAELRYKDPSNDSYTLGVNLPFGENAVLGVYLNEPIRIPTYPDFDEDEMAFVPISPEEVLEMASFERTLTVYYGMAMNEFNFAAGLTIGMDSYKEKFGTLSFEESTRYLALTGGLSSEKMDLGIELELPATKQELGDEEYTWDRLGINLAGRMFMEQSDDMSIIPYGFFSIAPSTYEAKEGSQKYETDLSDLDLVLGVGMNKMLGEKNRVILGLEAIGLHSAKMEDKDPTRTVTRTVLTMPAFFAGVESEIRPWLIGRIGAMEHFSSVKHVLEMEGVDDLEVSESFSDLDVTFGLGIRFSRFEIDAVLNENLLFDGPNFISGSNDQMAHRLSVTCDLD